METRREEAAPTFPTWRRRLEEASPEALPHEVERFLQVLRAVGTPMVDGADVHFIYYGPEAHQVQLVGEFNQWNRQGIPMSPLDDTGFFYHTMQVRGPARVEYKFIVDGEWTTDPFCPNTVDNGIGEQNSSFVVGDFKEPPELEWNPAIPHGRVEEFDFDSKILNNQRRVYVYLPPNYDTDSSRRFPTLYVHDGGEYLARARLATVLDNLIHAQEVPPQIAVMVDPVDRMREYWASEDYSRFTENELLPFVDKKYRTIARREARGVMGASLGGLISTYLALSRPHLFSKVGGQSSALFLLEGDRLSGLAAEIQRRFAVLPRRWVAPKSLSALVEQLRLPIAFYFDVGKYEPQFIPAHHRLVPLLEAKGCPCLFQELTGGHNWTSWRAHLKDLLTFLWNTPLPQTREEEVRGAPAQQGEALSPAPATTWDFDTVFNRFITQWERFFPGWLRPSGWDSTTEIVAEGDTLSFKIALPGFSPQDIEILVVGNQIVIKGEQTAPTQYGFRPFFSLPSRRFERIFPLPEGVAADQITACTHDGVLEIRMPMPKGMAPRRVPIEVREERKA
ncbi:MAG TPA: alpha/beta hydrolase-fold protein [Methylomirabilota bacterium]|nr:alpha/beta hydrolase-fold protein [Methylomirabilota bacterium]